MSEITSDAQSPAEPGIVDEGLDRGLNLFGLTWTAVGSTIGSGWLFGALLAVTYAGPSALIGWLAASAMIVLLAMVLAELGGMFPVSGACSLFSHYSFGSFAGLTFGWAAYLQAAATAPIEVLAALQYLATASWARGLYQSHSTGPGTLTGTGILVAAILLLLFVCVNLIGIRWLARANNAITTWKVLIPVLTIVVLLLTHFHTSNFSAGGGFFVHGDALKSIMIAIPTGGIVFAFTGFEQALQVGGEARKKRDIPKATIIAILLTAGIYTLLQVVFIGALSPHTLKEAGSWLNLGSSNTNPSIVALNTGPFYTVVKVAGLAWLAVLLRIDAVASPGGNGLMYVTTTARLSFGLAKNGYMPKVLQGISKRSRVPLFGLLASWVIGMLFLLPFPSWSALMSIITSACVLMYASAPLALGALRKQKPELERPYRVRGAAVLAPMTFVFASWIVYWSGWQTDTTLAVAMLVGYALFALARITNRDEDKLPMDWRAASWIVPYLIGMLVISYFGGFGAGGIIGGIGIFKNVLASGGNNDLGLWGGLIATAALALATYYFAISRRLPEREVDENVRKVFPVSE